MADIGGNMKKTVLLSLVLVFSASTQLIALAGPAKPGFIDSTLPPIWRNSSPKERLKALRVAQLDAFRALAERIQGFELESGTNVFDYMLISDSVKTKMQTLIKGATETEDPEYLENGMVTVVYGVKLNKIVEILKTEKSFKKVVTTKSEKNEKKIIEAVGCGALPESKAMKMLLAKRAAELDAYRKMTERFVGVKINSKTSVRDLCLTSDRVEAAAVAFLKGIKPIKITYSDDCSCKVVMQLKIREIVKTVETLTKIYNDGKQNKISNIDVTTNDKVFTVTGNGAPRDNEAPAPASAEAYKSERSVMQEILKQEVVVE